MRWLLLAAAAALIGGCGRADAEPAETPPPEALAPVAGTPLADALELLDRRLASALDQGLEGGGLHEFVVAEAITDRLLETQHPFPWLSAGGYSLDARLRQIQALADRITAAVGSSAPTDSVLVDLRRLRRDVTELRQALAQGGGPAPMPLERLLAGRDTLDLSTGEAAGGE